MVVFDGPKRTLRGWIRNVGPQRLAQTRVVFPGHFFSVGDIEPGQRIEVDALPSFDESGYSTSIAATLADMYERRPQPGRVTLVAKIEELDTGPQIGRPTGRSETHLLLFLANRKGDR